MWIKKFVVAANLLNHSRIIKISAVRRSVLIKVAVVVWHFANFVIYVASKLIDFFLKLRMTVVRRTLRMVGHRYVLRKVHGQAQKIKALGQIFNLTAQIVACADLG